MSASSLQEKTQLGFLRYDRTVGITAMEGRGFYFPADTSIGKDGKLYVASRSNYLNPRAVRVTVCDLEGGYFGVFGSRGEEPGQFTWVTCITVDSHGLVYVSDDYTHKINIFDSEGKYQGRWGVHGSGEGELDGPSGIAVDSEDNLFVADTYNNRIQKFTRDGKFLYAFGSRGNGDGEFDLPWGVTVDPKGEVYVADWRNDRVQRFTSSGRFLAQYGKPGSGDAEFHRPASVAVDRDGYVYVADWGNERVQVLDSQGDFVQELRGEATLSPWAEEFLNANVEEARARAKSDLEPVLESASGDPYEESSHVEKYFWAPVSVKLDDVNRLYVTESNRHRVQVYERSG